MSGMETKSKEFKLMGAAKKKRGYSEKNAATLLNNPLAGLRIT